MNVGVCQITSCCSSLPAFHALHTLASAECSSCPHQWYPYCANSAQYGPSTFANCCYAKCNNVAIIKQVLHAGVCLDKCSTCDSTLERPLCCKGRTYKNGCYAACNEEDTSQCSLGRCSTSKSHSVGLSCYHPVQHLLKLGIQGISKACNEAANPAQLHYIPC